MSQCQDKRDFGWMSKYTFSSDTTVYHEAEMSFNNTNIQIQIQLYNFKKNTNVQISIYNFK